MEVLSPDIEAASGEKLRKFKKKKKNWTSQQIPRAIEDNCSWVPCILERIPITGYPKHGIKVDEPRRTLGTNWLYPETAVYQRVDATRQAH